MTARRTLQSPGVVNGRNFCARDKPGRATFAIATRRPEAFGVFPLTLSSGLVRMRPVPRRRSVGKDGSGQCVSGSTSTTR